MCGFISFLPSISSILVMSLCFIGFVTFLQVFGKLYLHRSIDGASGLGWVPHLPQSHLLLLQSHDNLLRLSKPMEGLKEWLEAVYTTRIPCAVVSSLDRRSMVKALEQMGLEKYFQAIVTEEDGMDSIAHRFLSAAMKLDRKPSKCVVFEDEPRGITAAHNCTMMAVGLIGAHPAYDLVQAETYMYVHNLRTLENI